MVLVPLFTALTQGWALGWASTPYDPSWEQRYPRRAAWMAAAGPGANFLIAILALILLRIGLETGTFAAPEQVNFSRLVFAETPIWDGFGRFLSMLLTLNVILGLFNLIPVPPLDGSSVITLFFSDDTALRVRETLRGRGFAIFGLVAAWILFREIVRPVWSLLLRLVHPDLIYS